MGAINRGAVVIKPRQAFLEWLWDLPVPITDITLEQLREDCSVYLIPDWTDAEHLQRMLERCCGDMFEEELGAWCTDEAAFPLKRTWAVFREWFDVEPHSLVLNLMDGPLVDEEDAA